MSVGDLTPEQMENEISVALAGRVVGRSRVSATRDDGTLWTPATPAPAPSPSPTPASP